MSEELFDVFEHVIPGQHLREYHFGQKSEQDVIQLSIREYRPKNNADPGPDSITLIAAHGNSDPCPALEPLWDDLVSACAGSGVKIRAIWAMDCFNKGASGVLNEQILGDDASIFDYTRDLLCMVNHFRARMVRPIVGTGHSSGCPALIHLSAMHPRLFHSLMLMEPIFAKEEPRSLGYAEGAARQPDVWPSRAAAETWFRSRPLYRQYERRMLDAYLKCHLRDTPTAVYPAGSVPEGSVTAATTKAQQVWGLGRPNWRPATDDPLDTADRLLQPDASAVARRYSVVRAECQQAEAELPHLRPGVLWLYGKESVANPPDWRESQTGRTGTGTGGSRGEKLGLVRRIDIEGAGHILPQQKPKECAAEMARWLETEVIRFREETEFVVKNKVEKSTADMLRLSEGYGQKMKYAYQLRPGDKLAKEKL